ncbi:MAG TPA: hypothetical protein PLZ20_08655, partial [Nitrospira sp.]|nr:hypothetical protein [Nitrospira sp.]
TVHPFAWCAVVAGASGGPGGGVGVESVMAFPAYKEGVFEKIKVEIWRAPGLKLPTSSITGGARAIPIRMLTVATTAISNSE